MQPLSERLKSGEVLVADGAMGTMLFERGLTPGECPERINLERPELLQEIARLYVDAGSDFVSANTFGGSPLKLAQYGLDGRTEEINIAGVRAARAAVGNRAYVAASLGSCGRMLLPYGDVEPEEVAAGFERQIRALVEAGIDILFIETMTDLAEAKLAIQAAKTVAPSLPVTATMTFDPTPRGFFTIMGNSIVQAAEGLAEAGADVIGSNCGNGIEKMIQIAAEFRKCTSLPLIIQANAGLPEMRDGRPVYAESPEFFAAGCRRLLDVGVTIIGGCCGTTPEHIAAIRTVVDESGPADA